MTTESNHSAELRARMIELAGEVAAARERAEKYAVERACQLGQECELVEQLHKAESRNRELEQQVLALFGPTAAPVDHSAELRAALAETRIVFQGEPMAADVLNYLDAMLAAGAQVPAQTGIAAGGNASIAEESLAGVGDAPTVVVEEDWGPAYFRLRATYVDLARRYDQLEARHDELKSDVAATFDQAAAAMAADSAKTVADAERSVAARGDQPLVELACEVRNEADDIDQPVNITLQLLMLVEQRRTNELLLAVQADIKWRRNLLYQSRPKFS